MPVPAVSAVSCLPHFSLLATPGFVAAMAVMLLNDLVLKSAFHNTLTGKISDFSGVFAFCLFLSACMPRHLRVACVVGALLFAWWKTPFSEPVIAAWNQLEWWPVARVQDWSDILAVAMAPLAWAYARSARPFLVLPAMRVSLALCSALVFSAQSAQRRDGADSFVSGQIYEVPRTVDALRREVIPGGKLLNWHIATDGESLSATISDDLNDIVAWFTLTEDMGVTRLRLNGFTVWPRSGGESIRTNRRSDEERERMRLAWLALIERIIVNPIGAHAVQVDAAPAAASKK